METSSDHPLPAYESLAHYYDDFTHGYEHDAWLSEIEALAREHGLRGRRVLDAACGTGKSTLPLLRRGYAVSASDLSPAMLRIARRRLGPGCPTFAADMRRLPAVSSFDLVTCLDDSVNYLTRAPDLLAALRSFRRVLRPEGLLVFDVNSRRTFDTVFAARFERARREHSYRWRGLGCDRGLFRAEIEVRDARGAPIVRSRHAQRHWSLATLADALRRAGLVLVLARGQVSGGRLDSPPDENSADKLLLIARRDAHADRGGETR